MGTGEKGNNIQAKDLLSLLVRANLASDLTDTQKMTDDDVLARKFVLYCIHVHFNCSISISRNRNLPCCRS